MTKNKSHKADHDVRSHRIGLYVRVSTEEQAENPEGSIKSQEQRLRTQVELQNQEESFGEIKNVFIDRARSGKDANRPELQRMLQAIRRGEITLVMVTELSRLSRSIKDICEIWELLREHGCEFLSLREKFDTTTAAGEMVLYTIANIAQFERKQCSERIRANFQARASRGLFNGGSVPIGYELDPEHKGHLKVNEPEATIVREAFQTFLSEGSLSKAGKALNERGFRLSRRRQGGGDKTRLGYFTVDNLYGIRTYQVKGETKTTRACWPPLIEEYIFNQVKKQLKANYRRLKTSQCNRFPFLLSGLAVCGSCGNRLPGKSAHGNGGKIPYYEHAWATKRQAYLNQKVFHCDPHRVLAKKLEPAVWEDVLQVLTTQEMAESIIKQAHEIHGKQAQVSEGDRLRTKFRDLDIQIEALAEHLAKIPKGMSPAPVFTQMEKLGSLKDQTQKELDRLCQGGGTNELPASLKDYAAYLKLIREVIAVTDSLELRTKIIQKLVHKVEVLPKTFRIHYHAGQNRFLPMQPDKGPGVHTLGSPSNYFLFSGSNSLTNGGGDRT